MLTIEDIKKELREYRDNEILIDNQSRIKEKIEQIRARAESTTKELSDMPKGSPQIQDKIAECVADIVDIELSKVMATLEMEKQNSITYNTIFKLEQPFKNILYYKYIEGYSLKEVAENIIFREEKHTSTLHGKALILYLKERNKAL